MRWSRQPRELAEYLDLERKWWAISGSKDEAIRALGLTPIRYYQRLNHLADWESALAYNATVVIGSCVSGLRPETCPTLRAWIRRCVSGACMSATVRTYCVGWHRQNGWRTQEFPW
ncbi:DUF3263 domain-containing protein [Mycobacterium hackensackense]|nr:DUF3263 domain-containing protein [Mycobacterium hackensackense]